MDKLTFHPVKEKIYKEENLIDYNKVIPQSIYPFASLIIKPDFFTWSNINILSKILKDEGLKVVYQKEFTFNNDISSLIWKYQWNRASEDRISLTNLMLRQSSSLYLLLYKETTTPTSVLLWMKKGSSEPFLNNNNHIRYHLGSINKMLNFIHAADEPIDVLREGKIIFGDDNIIERAKPLALNNLCLSKYVRNDQAQEKVKSLEKLKQEYNFNFLSEYPLEFIYKETQKSIENIWEFILLASELIKKDKEDHSQIISSKNKDQIFSLWKHYYRDRL